MIASIFELPTGLANSMVFIDSNSMFKLLVGLVNRKVVIDRELIHWYKIYSEKCPVGL